MAFLLLIAFFVLLTTILFVASYREKKSQERARATWASPPAEGPPVFEVDSVVEGPIHRPGETVRVLRDARVAGKISADRVEIQGRVEGTIEATTRVDLDEDSFFEGEITAPRVVVSDGAEFRATRVDIAVP